MAAMKSISFFGAFAVEFVITAVLMFAILALGDENNGAFLISMEDNAQKKVAALEKYIDM